MWSLLDYIEAAVERSLTSTDMPGLIFMHFRRFCQIVGADLG